jgi:hypothetical protein
VRITYKRCVTANFNEDSNTSTSEPDDKADENLDKTANQISGDPKARQAQVDEIGQRGRQRMDKNAITYHIAGYEFNLQGQIAQAAQFVQWGKSVIDKVVKASPGASLPWCGICLILPLFTLPSEAEKANRVGFTYVTGRMHYYVRLEPLLFPKNLEPTAEDALKPIVVDLYQHILEFQLKSVVRFFRHWLGNLGQDLTYRDDWSLSKVKALEEILDRSFGKINDAAVRIELEALSNTATESLQTMHKLLSVAEEQRDIQRIQVYVIPSCSPRSSVPNTK